MKVRIDVLKAPWPSGAKVGDVVVVERISPAFVGKCSPVSDDEPVTASFADAEFVVQQVAEGEGATSEEVAQAVAEAGDVVVVEQPAKTKGKAK
jgi:hypothetical protein